MPTVTIPKNREGAWELRPGSSAKHNLQPGDVVEMEGDYSYIYIDSVIGTKEQPIVFKPKGIVRVGTANSFAWIITNSKHFIIDGVTDADKYSFKIGGPEKGKFIAQSFTFPTSDNFEIKGVEIANAQVGFFGNPKSGRIEPYENIKIHDNYVHDLDNPDESGRSEGIYLGRTDAASITKPGSFNNVEIYNNRFENLAGDGIQAALTKNLKIYDNVINGYGGADLEQQRSAIIIGGCTSGTVSHNAISNGKGAAIQVFGGGLVTLEKNEFNNVATSANEDAIYIDGKCADEKLQVVLSGNKLSNKPARDIVRDASKSIVDSKGNSWETPIPPVEPPKPVKTVLKKGYWLISGKRYYYTAYTDFTWENKK